MTTFQQQSTARKFIYFGLIVGLFTFSILHRSLLIDRHAQALGVREVDKGAAVLTDQAIRFSVTGVRGLAVCILWNIAIEQQKKHQYNELENTVASLTKLQPHFISPWLFQSWNLAFNVSVECDRPRDKYFYIARGLALLVEGERRNQGNQHIDPNGTPANPDLRWHVGFTYQLKIAQGDEQRYLRSLFEMSCIDPLERDADQMWAAGTDGEEVDLVKFQAFCEKNPRLVRRLREQLRMQTPRAIVTFLKDNKDVPGRYQDKSPAGAKQTALKPAPNPDKPNHAVRDEQFPYLPIRRLNDWWPNPKVQDFEESVDSYRVAQAWYVYAQEPLPPEDADYFRGKKQPDLRRHRMPRTMAHLLFRSYPARSQAHIGESLQNDGWFDTEGWPLKDWFDPPGKAAEPLIVGRNPKYDSAEPWRKAYAMYVDYGTKNGLLLEARAIADLQKDAQRLGEQSWPGQKLQWYSHYRELTNFDSFLQQTFVERTVEAVEARKQLYRAKLARRENPELAMQLYEQALDQWTALMLRYPGYRQLFLVQDQALEAEQGYLKLWQDQNAEILEPLFIGMTQASGLWPRVMLAIDQTPLGVVPTKNAHGPLTRVYWREVKNDPIGTAAMLVGAGGLPALPLAQDKMTLAIEVWFRSPPNAEWIPLIADGAIHQMRGIPATLVEKKAPDAVK